MDTEITRVDPPPVAYISELSAATQPVEVSEIVEIEEVPYDEREEHRRAFLLEEPMLPSEAPTELLDVAEALSGV